MRRSRLRASKVCLLLAGCACLAGAQEAHAAATFQAKVSASDGAADDRFGGAVSLYNDTLAVGALRDDDMGTDSGSVYVWLRTGASWALQAKLTANDGQAGDHLGNAVALYGDTLLAGAYNDDDRGADAGAVYVFQRFGTSWVQMAKLRASDGVAGDLFGAAVGFYGDTAVITAPKDDDKGSNAGSAYVFVRSGTAWNQQAKLTASDGAANDSFGYSASVSGDTAIVGAAFDSTTAGTYAGSAYVFLRSGTVWTQQAKLTASDGAASDSFGDAVSIDGDTALVGSFGDDAPLSNAGSTYVFVRSGAAWSQQAKLTAADPAASNNFGSSVFVSGDTAAIGAVLSDAAGADSGAAYVFKRSGTAWTQQDKLVAGDGAAGDGFGIGVSMSLGSLASGAYLDDDHGADSGSAYVYVVSQPLPDQDGDGAPDATDNCPSVANPSQTDSDADGAGDACDGCPLDAANDVDQDGVCGNLDNCPTNPNADQFDTDHDGRGDACDACRLDPSNDADGDGVCGDVDDCPSVANPGQTDSDGDGAGDACDACALDPANDVDHDGICGNVDNCPTILNGSQTDTDHDGIGDVCDTCSQDADNDADHDGVCGNFDNCPGVSNADQLDTDHDGRGDVCDVCPLDLANDADGDGRCANLDNCPLVANPDQADSDGDAKGDACDTCALDPLNDADHDGICGNVDNCPSNPNGAQTDTDHDGIGDACDACTDRDGDGYGNPPAAGCAHPQLDCDDANPAVNPGAVEVPGNGIDDDCNAGTPSCGSPKLANAEMWVDGRSLLGDDDGRTDLGIYLIPASLVVFGLRRRLRRSTGISR